MTSHLGYTITKEDGLYIVDKFDMECATLGAAKSFIQRKVDAVAPRLVGRNLR
jgi:hypothetical protein